MLGSGQFERCNLPAISGDVASAKSLVIKHSNAVARTRRWAVDRSPGHATVVTVAPGAPSWRRGSYISPVTQSR